MPRRPHPRSCFFEQTVFQKHLGQCLLQVSRLTLQAGDFTRHGLPGVSPDKHFFPASRNSFDQL
jgi:hypothetical protein